MKAIRLTKENREKILAASPVDKVRLDQMIAEYDVPGGPGGLYFVPQSDIAHELNSTSWMTLPYVLLHQGYNFDQNKINSEFVEIHPKHIE